MIEIEGNNKENHSQNIANLQRVRHAQYAAWLDLCGVRRAFLAAIQPTVEARAFHEEQKARVDINSTQIFKQMSLASL